MALFVDLVYTDDIVLFNETLTKCNLLTSLSTDAGTFGIPFSLSECKMLLQDCLASSPEFTIGNEVVELVDRFTSLKALIGIDRLLSQESSISISQLASLLV